MQQGNRNRRRVGRIVVFVILVIALLAALAAAVLTHLPGTHIAQAPTTTTPVATFMATSTGVAQPRGTATSTAGSQGTATSTAGSRTTLVGLSRIGMPCGVTDPALIEAAAPLTSATPVHPFAGGLSATAPYAVSDFAIFSNPRGPDEMYILDAGARTVHILSMATGSPSGSFSVPGPLAGDNLALDGEGNVYLAQAPDAVVKLTPAGQTVWTYSAPLAQGQVVAVYAAGTPRGFRLGGVQGGAAGSLLLDARGRVVGSSRVGGEGQSLYTRDDATGDIVMTDGHYVRRYDRDGAPRLAFGSVSAVNDSGPFHFHQLGGAVTAPDGTVYIADAGRGIEAATRDGLYEGVALESAVGSLTADSPLAIYHGDLYYAGSDPLSGRQSVSRISLSDLRALIAAPKAPQPVLGYGAGLVMSAPENYVPPGQTPAVSLMFDPWWEAHAEDLRGTYTVRTRDQVQAGDAGTAYPFKIPVVPAITTATTTTVTALATAATTTTTTITSTTITTATTVTTATAALTTPLQLPPARPGYYQVEAQLFRGGAIVGAACLSYGVGAPGDTLDVASLPDAPDFGGAPPARNVALAGALGLRLVRAGIDWNQLLPGGASSTAPLTFTVYDTTIGRAAQEAAANGVTLEVQVGQGSPVDKALVANGTWQARVQELVGHYRGVVHAWEAWNEPNGTFGDAADYTSKVLLPFYHAVKAADPSALVVGGSVLGVDLSYYDGIGAAGGFAAMDVVGVHPYPGHNRSFEEEGFPERIRQLHALLARYHAGTLPVWDTEIGWWSDGTANLYSQADKLIRLLLLLDAVGISATNYLELEGGYGGSGLSDSLIQYAGPQNPSYVKPAALAAMTLRTQTGGRPFLGLLATGVPHAYAAFYGPNPAASASSGAASASDTLAVWTDDLQLRARVTLTATVPGGGASGSVPAMLSLTDEFGLTSSIAAPGGVAPIPLDGSVRYLAIPPGVGVTLTTEEGFGPDLALASNGARATASSAAPHNPASAALDGVSDAAGGGDWPGLSAWASGVGDATPTLTIMLGQPRRVDRVLLSSHSIGSVVPGLRNYDVEVQTPGGPWATVARVRDEFYWRRRLVMFSAREVSALRVVCLGVNYGSLAGGLKPWFWPTDQASMVNAAAPWYGPAVIYEVEAYGPSGIGMVPTPTSTATVPVSSTATATASPTVMASPTATGTTTPTATATPIPTTTPTTTPTATAATIPTTTPTSTAAGTRGPTATATTPTPAAT